MMKERPILFSAPMVRAILDGRKTQTRRPVKLKNGQYMPPSQRADKNGWAQLLRNCPYGQPGDRLWVRETFAIVPRTACARSDGVQQTLRPDDPYDHDAAIYREGWARSNGGFRWRPSIHMPRWACRLELEITSVRVERLQDISEADAQSEGATPYLLPVNPAREGLRHVDGFATLWESINGPGSWEANPWVWVVEFRRIPACN